LNDWDNTKARAAQIEKDFGGHPQVAYALARSYRADHREADAKRLLERTIKIAPDVEVFEELAATIQPQEKDGNDPAALGALMKMLAGGGQPDQRPSGVAGAGGNEPVEDFGLSLPKVADKRARELIAMGKPEEALPVARQAAQSGAQWACQTLIGNLTLLKKYDEAEALARETQERYPVGMDWYLWCEMTGRGNRAAARADAARNAEELAKSSEDGDRLGAGIFFQMQGNDDRAAACFDAQLTSDSPEQLFKLLYAMLEFGRKDAKAALKVISTGVGVREMVGEHRGEIYRTAELELRECFESADGKRLPARDGDVKQWILDDRKPQYRANVCYWFGRVCEQRGDKDQAKFWYREALSTTDWTFACRGMAGVGLRRLGENFFKD
jgi:tetratricopeptide (TPR) repeat protein